MRLKTSIAILLLLLGCARGAETPLIGLEYGSKEYENKNLVLLDNCIGRLTDCSGNLLTSSVQPQTMPCAALGSPANGTVYYCPDCTLGSIPCTCGGTGTLAVRLAGAWACGTGGAALVLPGLDTQVLYNDGGSLGADSGLTFNETTNVLTAGGFVGPLTGNVTGNVTGNLTGNSAGTHTGAVIGNVTGNVTGNLTGNVTGNVTGNLTGNVTGGTVEGTLTDKGGQGCNVMASNFGAVCDGTTNDSAAFALAIAACPTKCVLVPSTTSGCRLNSVFTLTKNACLMGLGGNARLLAGTNSQTLLAVNGSHIRVENLKLSKVAGTTGVTIIATNTAHNTQTNHNYFHNLDILGESATRLTAGILLDAGAAASCLDEELCTAVPCAGAADCGAFHNVVERVRVRYATSGIKLTGSGNFGANGSFITDVALLDNTTGLDITKADTAEVKGAAFSGSTTALWIRDSAGADNNSSTFSGLRFEGNTVDVQVDASSFNNEFIVAEPTIAKWVIDAGVLSSTSIYASINLWRTTWGNFSATDGILHLSPSNSTIIDQPLTLNSTLRDPTATANDIGFGFTGNLAAGNCAGASCYFAIKAPNANFGPALTVFGDSVGKTLDIRSQAFNSTTNTGSGCSVTSDGTDTGVICANAGTSSTRPFLFNRTARMVGNAVSNVTCGADTVGTYYFDTDRNEMCFCKDTGAAVYRYCLFSAPATCGGSTLDCGP